jgi:Na+/melibiose symporter-like transporter
MQNKTNNQKLIFLSILLLILLAYPFISLANKVQLLFGIPILYLYIFIVWIIAIIICYRIVERNQKENNE